MSYSEGIGALVGCRPRDEYGVGAAALVGDVYVGDAPYAPVVALLRQMQALLLRLQPYLYQTGYGTFATNAGTLLNKLPLALSSLQSGDFEATRNVLAEVAGDYRALMVQLQPLIAAGQLPGELQNAMMENSEQFVHNVVDLQPLAGLWPDVKQWVIVGAVILVILAGAIIAIKIL